jgi:small subunit ribosomal protein S5
VAETNVNVSAPQAAPSGRPERGFFGGDGRGGPRRRRQPDSGSGDRRDDIAEKVLFINRSSKVVKGGRRFGFSALVVAGDRTGRIGLGLGKGSEVAESIRKGTEDAKGAMVPVAISGNTIPHEVYAEFGGAKVLLRPASPGTGLICGKTVRAVVESCGLKDLLSKSLGSKNAANVAKATMTALLQLRSREQIMAGRGLTSRLEKKA